MAGIGFELVRLLNKNNYTGLLRAYSLSALIASGPGLLIIFSLGLICFFSFVAIPRFAVVQVFLTVIIYLFVGSMVISSLLQFTMTRFIADLDFLKQFDRVTPNYLGVLLVQLLLSAGISLPLVLYFFSDYSLLLKFLMISIFNVLTLIWISSVFLTGAKSYRRILWSFTLGYSAMIMVHFACQEQQNNLNFLLFEFLLAQCILFIGLLYSIIDLYPSNQLIEFSFLKKNHFYYTLVASSFFYSLGFWIDKCLFWYNQDTGYTIMYPLRISPVYDLPVFISLLTMLPGIAVFMLDIESNFSLIYPKIMDTIFRRKTLAEIHLLCDELVLSGRSAIYRLIKTQLAIIISMYLSVYALFSVFDILPIYLNLLLILIIGAGLNVILWALLNLLYYMTKYVHALLVSAVFLVANGSFTLLSLYAGPVYYGYGVGVSLMLAIATALFLLNEDFKNIAYTAFMMTD